MIRAGLYLSTADTREELRFNNGGEYNHEEISYISYDNNEVDTFWFGKLISKNERFEIQVNCKSWQIEQKNKTKFETAELSSTNLDQLLLKFGSISKTFDFTSAYFRAQVEISYATENGFHHQRKIDTGIIQGSHPTDPPFKKEILSIREVFERVGIKLLKVRDDQFSVHPNVRNRKWSDAELNALMNQIRNTNNVPAISWSIWCFMAGEHEHKGTQGVMFDKLDDFQRQGAAMFEKNITKKLKYDKKPNHKDLWVKRMKHFITIHEIGHAFNFVHSHEPRPKNPWIKPDRLEERAKYSFMYYPWAINVQYDKFFQRFNYRFNRNEVRFLRHAPEAFVKMGGAAWATNHAFAAPKRTFFRSLVGLRDPFQLPINVGEAKGKFEYLEPVVVEYSLKNISLARRSIHEYLTMENGNRALSGESLHLTVRKKGTSNEVHEVHSGMHKFEKIEPFHLLPFQELTGSVFVGSDHDNWIIQDPGSYEIHATLLMENLEIHSNILEIEIAKPEIATKKAKDLAKTLHSAEMSRAMLFDGTDPENKVFKSFKKISEAFVDSKLAIHVDILLAMSLYKPFKYIELESLEIKERPADIKEAIKYFEKAFKNLEEAQITLGKTDFKHYYSVYKRLKLT